MLLTPKQQGQSEAQELDSTYEPEGKGLVQRKTWRGTENIYYTTCKEGGREGPHRGQIDLSTGQHNLG